jgi:cell division protein FtsJ
MSAAKRAIDPIAREAKRLGYVARSALKLVELDDKFALLRNLRQNARVLDLGCAPGAWIQVVHQRSLAHVVGIDLTEVTTEGMRFVEAARALTVVEDAMNFHSISERLGGARAFDLVLSDMMTSTSGISSVDAARSLDLAECAVGVALGGDGGGALRQKGDLVIKILEGASSVEALSRATKSHFAKVSWFKPKATRSESKEIYLVARGRKG